jgi:hypothetical protein
MSNTTVKVFMSLALLCVATTASHCVAQGKDPEAVARQAQIDADLAKSKIERLEEDQISSGVVQDEATVEISARNREIASAEEEVAQAERRRIEAERAEK